uniref:POPDC1-3 domain-containing protein n=1 Tax=Ciona savignyi TaxID=51511 RepID=H2Y532_CIOSA
MEDNDTNVYLPGSSCHEWISPQNLTFHVSMVLFLVSFSIPCTFKHYVITNRIFLMFGVMMLMLWGVLYWCTWDTVMWGVLLLVQIIAQLVYAIYKKRHIKFPSALEELYIDVFQTFNITRQEFKALVHQNCKWVHIFPGDKYAVEGNTTVEARVSMLVSGTLRVTYKGTFLHDIKDKQLIDSPEWQSTKLKRGESFQVTIEAVDRCFYLCWNREKLQYYLQVKPKLEQAFKYICGKDVMDKVYQTTLNAMRRSTNTRRESNEQVNATDIRMGLAEEDPSVIYK